MFQSTHSLRSATALVMDLRFDSKVSIHALLAECDPGPACRRGGPCRFNPRTPCGVRRAQGGFPARLSRGFNPRTPCGVRLHVSFLLRFELEFQSTHSLRSATIRVKYEDCPHIVSIHALLAECDPVQARQRLVSHRFNPRTPCGVRQSGGDTKSPEEGFQSTHSLRSATRIRWNRQNAQGFQSTHSLRSATPTKTRCVLSWPVSIHALLAECDRPRGRPRLSSMGFNPRTPCGVRPVIFTEAFPRFTVVSIHALLAECDLIGGCLGVFTGRFQSTHSLRSATGLRNDIQDAGVGFNPRTPCGVRQVPGHQRQGSFRFNPRTPCGVRPAGYALILQGCSFNPRTPCGVRPHCA